MFDSQDAFEKMLEPLMSCFTYYKHWAFAEEREVRLTTILNGHCLALPIPSVYWPNAWRSGKTSQTSAMLKKQHFRVEP
jgi:hypothetical protein